MDKTSDDVEVNHLIKIRIQGTKYGIYSNDVMWKMMKTPSVES